MMVVLTNEERKAAKTDQDRAALFNSMVAYTGMCREGDKWITKVDVSANLHWWALNRHAFSESMAIGSKR